MKIITILALAAAVIGMSACAHKEQSGMGSSSTMSHKTYSK